MRTTREAQSSRRVTINFETGGSFGSSPLTGRFPWYYARVIFDCAGDDTSQDWCRCAAVLTIGSTASQSPQIEQWFHPILLQRVEATDM